MNNSEKLLSAFSEEIFFEELVFKNLEFYLDEKHKVELADLMIYLKDKVLVIQLKAREESKQTWDLEKESQWVIKKCKIAKKQIKDTINYINSNTITFSNDMGNVVTISKSVEIVPLVVFINDRVDVYEHLLRKHNDGGMDINCISFNDYKEMCKKLLTPGDIIEYLKWRNNFYLLHGNIDILLTDTDWGVLTSKPQHKESLINQYLIEMFGDYNILEEKDYLLKFNYFVKKLNKHLDSVDTLDGIIELIVIFANFHQYEAKAFVERLVKTIDTSKNIKKTKICGSLRNILTKIGIIFVASEKGEFYSKEGLISIMNKDARKDIKTLLQIYIYWINREEYKIDFILYQEN